jgi:hypothetical protein
VDDELDDDVVDVAAVETDVVAETVIRHSGFRRSARQNS